MGLVFVLKYQYVEKRCISIEKMRSTIEQQRLDNRFFLSEFSCYAFCKADKQIILPQRPLAEAAATRGESSVQLRKCTVVQCSVQPFAMEWVTGVHIERHVIYIRSTLSFTKLGLSCAKLRAALASYQLTNDCELYTTELSKIAGA